MACRARRVPGARPDPRQPGRRAGSTRSSAASTPRPPARWSGLEAREHTAQVDPAKRQEREDAVPRRRAAGPVLLADDGARRRHHEPQRRRHAQRPADPGELRPALRAGRPIGPAGARAHLLRDRQRPRPLLLRPKPGHGRRRGRAAAARPGQRGPRPRPRPRHLAGRDCELDLKASMVDLLDVDAARPAAARPRCWPRSNPRRSRGGGRRRRSPRC